MKKNYGADLRGKLSDTHSRLRDAVRLHDTEVRVRFSANHKARAMILGKRGGN